jgi:UDP-glucose 6-dehydrogenase
VYQCTPTTPATNLRFFLSIFLAVNVSFINGHACSCARRDQDGQRVQIYLA